VLFPLLLLAGLAASPEPDCDGADPASTNVTSQLFKRHGGDDHFVITATITNVGRRSQTTDITQRVDLLRGGVVLAPQSVPALGAGVAYKLAFAVDRPSGQRSQPLTLTLRYVLSSGDSARNACNRSNDEITKTF
jgi:hypothetical protein